MKQNGHLENPGPIRPGLLQDLPHPLQTQSRLILDPTGDDGTVDQRHLARYEDEVTEGGSAGEGGADGSEVGDIVITGGKRS